MSGNLVAIHFGPKANPAEHDKVIARAYGGLIDAIEVRGFETVITRGADSYDFDEGTIQEHWRPQRNPDDDLISTRRLGGLAMEALGSVRDLGKKLRPSAQYPLALLNTPEVISYDDSKHGMYVDILYGMQGETHLLGADTPDVFSSGLLVVKPDKGSGGRGVHVIEREQLNGLMDHLMKTVPDTLHVVQEYVDMTQPFPPDVKGLDGEETDMLEKLKGRKKELRVFCSYGKDGAMQLVPIARMMKEGTETSDTWVFIDPDYIPSEIVELTTVAFARLDDKTHAGEIFGAIDFIWGSTVSQPELSWRAGEINMWKPAVNRRKPEIGRRVDNALASQLVRMANG
jgi:hypothetical protein